MSTTTSSTSKAPAKSARCTEHPAFEADNCPTCGTSTPISERAAAPAKTSAAAKPAAPKTTRSTAAKKAAGPKTAPVKAPAKSTAKAAESTSETPAEGTTSRRKPAPSLASKDGTQKCQGACGKRLPITKFPTLNAKPGEVPQRGKICRDDMRALRAAKKAAAAEK